ncbi:MAG: hypothetical protein IID33_03405 [Planctomycetes bacterium]|nr:hypothetical protein [Planctomycetota bacterium]
MRVCLIIAVLTALCGGCAGRGRAVAAAGVWVARLSGMEAEDDLTRLREAFVRRNPGYDLAYHPSLDSLTAERGARVLFVQSGKAQAKVAATSSEIDVGDIVVLRIGETLSVRPPIAALVFRVPAAPPDDLPTFIRPDWDPQITDTPGGCATEEGAYRRILLTWQKKNGPYIYHAINAHRVRITDSFTHYHPLQGGFDEFYLVQMVQRDASLITSCQVDKITAPESVARSDVTSLLEFHKLAVGDLVYMPRGTAHRGLGGVLAQVISVPGFRPNAEIGVDHHLVAINDRLGLTGDAALPYNAQASLKAVVK